MSKTPAIKAKISPAVKAVLPVFEGSDKRKKSRRPRMIRVKRLAGAILSSVAVKATMMPPPW